MVGARDTVHRVEQRVSIVTLGVSDIARSRGFYEALGWRGQEVEETVFFQAGGEAIVLWAATSSRPTPESRTTAPRSAGSSLRTRCGPPRRSMKSCVSRPQPERPSPDSRPTPSAEVTQAASEILMAICGRSRSTPASHSTYPAT